VPDLGVQLNARPNLDSQEQAVISEGDPSPDFSLQADDGSVVTRDSLKGKKAILFFYPKDNTSG
jgi:peroxiredoxin